jgi:aldose 1-epimerase
LRGTDGACAELWVDENYAFVEAYTGDTLDPSRARRGLGVEPMTCPPNAFVSGEALITLAPGDSVTTTWGVCLSRRH